MTGERAGWTARQIDNASMPPGDAAEVVLAAWAPPGRRPGILRRRARGEVSRMEATETQVVVHLGGAGPARQSWPYLAGFGWSLTPLGRRLTLLEFSLPAAGERDARWALRLHVRASATDEGLLAFLSKVEEARREYERLMTEFRPEAAERQARFEREKFAFWDAYLDARSDREAEGSDG